MLPHLTGSMLDMNRTFT